MAPEAALSDSIDRFAAELLELPDTRARRDCVRRCAALHERAAVVALTDRVLQSIRIDLERAERLAHAAYWIAEIIRDDYARALGMRAIGHVLYSRARYEAALQHYQAAAALLRPIGDEIEVGRTLSSALQTLIYLGRYGDALAWAHEARSIFGRHGDSLRLARLDLNTANILYRQDRFEEALELYRKACAEFQAGAGTPQDVAAALSNMAVTSISLNDFALALQYYQEARAYCAGKGMPLLVAEADYNIAYLHYLRGEYTLAIELYEDARKNCQRLGDPYHEALCDLDQSEMYIELNLSDDGARLAERAYEQFRKLGMGYETAKAMTNLAIAASHQGRSDAALDLFRQASGLFEREANHVWPALIQLYQAIVLHRAGRPQEARRPAASAFRFFSRSQLRNKAALAELLLARLDLDAGHLQRSAARCSSALRRLERAQSPALSYQAWFVLGQVREAQRDRRRAYRAYREAHARLEDLRSRLRGEELKIAFLQDKLAVYENLVSLCLERVPGRRSVEAAFAYIEQAKSRSLADLIAFRAQTLPAAAAAGTHTAAQLRRIREELNCLYRSVEIRETRPDAGAPLPAQKLRDRIVSTEQQMAELMREIRATDREFNALQNGAAIDVETIRAAIPGDAALIEYYQARGRMYAILLAGDSMEAFDLCATAKLREVFRLLQFQLSKFRLGESYLSTFGPRLEAATHAHLRELYDLLIRPLRRQIRARRLIVVPHDTLHYVPFHALHDGREYLTDVFSISYAPSASVFYLCAAKPPAASGPALILGIPDPLTPFITEEVEAVSATMPGARVFLGAAATEKPLHQFGADSRFVHIATHGLFRQDNPMFSSIRLGTSQLTLYDLYQLRLGAELVTLSGCGTGLNVVVGGDELLGLVRGLLYAGSRAVLATLWDVHDQSTAAFMKSFYRALGAGVAKAEAARQAMREVRDRYPHPYYWAPFILTGGA